MHSRIISLDSLSHTREREIEELLAGIQGKPGSVLWTSDIRATTRGGMKCMVTPMIEEAP